MLEALHYETRIRSYALSASLCQAILVNRLAEIIVLDGGGGDLLGFGVAKKLLGRLDARGGEVVAFGLVEDIGVASIRLVSGDEVDSTWRPQ